MYEKSTKGAAYINKSDTKTMFKPIASIWWMGILTYVCPKAVTLNLTNQPFSTFIKQVEQQTDYKFFFEEQSVDVDRLINVKAQNQDIKVVLDRVLGGTNLTYTIANKKILLKKHESQKPQKGKRFLMKSAET